MSQLSWPDDSIFEPFDVFETVYKTVAGHDIKAAVLMPKSLAAGRHPVMLYVHGGFFATAHSLFAPFFAPWFVDPALKHGGIIVSADYRLLPTANGIADQLADLEDFWQWTRRDLPAILESRAPGHTLDFDHLALVGGSAGGYFATQLALSHPDEVSVLAIAYPGLDLKDHIFVSGPRSDAPALLQFPESQIPSKDDSLAWVQEHRKVVESKRNIDFTPFCVGLVQHGEFSKQMLEFGDTVLTTDELPIERVRNGGRLPKNVWITHGDSDTVVYLRQSEKLVDLIKEKLPATNLRFDIAKGQDHGFDVDPKLWAPYAEPATAFVVDGWLR